MTNNDNIELNTNSEVKQMDENKFSKLYTLTEAQNVLGVSHRTMLRYVYDNKLQAKKIGGRWKVSEEELRRFVGK